VAAISKIKSGAWDYVREDVRAVTEAIHARGGIVKVIFETAFLTDDEIVRMCGLCEQVGADFVKTSTGYAPAGATLEHVRLMRASVGPAVSVKAAGGIRTLDQLLAYRAAGAKMIGTRSTVEIIQEARARFGD
jgi:deoxyribose-phosphate aldolase